MGIAALNDRYRAPTACFAVACGVVILATALFIARVAWRVGLDAVPSPGDAPDYDLLAMELAAGHGFRFDYDNPRWRSTYESADQTRYANSLSRHGSAKTTIRPPLFPVLLAGIYATAGRQFDIARIVNCLLMAAAGGLIAWLVARQLGPIPAIFFGFLFAILEHRTRFYAGLLLTESLATFLVCALVVTLAGIRRSGMHWRPFIAGLLAGLAILTRPLLVLWLPLLLPLVWQLGSQRGWKTAGLFLFGTTLIVAPWGVRNSLLLGRFAMLGTHGRQNLAAAYSDQALDDRGIWYRLDETDFFPTELDDSRPGVARELDRAALSTQAAIAWSLENPTGVVKLIALRIWQLWRPRMRWDGLILGLAAFGWCLWPDRREWYVFSAILIGNTLAVGLTWSVGGRFLVPVLPILHALGACGLWAAWGLATGVDRTWLATWLQGPSVVKKSRPLS